jgi:hypothetical protein
LNDVFAETEPCALTSVINPASDPPF